MSDGSQIERHAAPAIMRKKRKIPLVWIVPLVALVLGGWLAVKAIREQGPTISITFSTADGLEAGKTKIKFKDVEIGMVESIRLNDNASKVVVTAKMVKGSEPYLTDQSKFWVVRPRISGGSVSGLETMLSGAYIGIDGNRSGSPATSFVGLEVPPVVTVGQPGRHFVLKAEKLGSLDIRAPVYYRQIQVGRVVGYGFDPNGKTVNITIFVEAPHHAQVTENTRFWNASGINVNLNAQGLKVETQSMISILSGGIAFDLPKETPPGEAAKENATFDLYADQAAIQEKKYSLRDYYMFLFDESVRGLSVGAPVELYGIKLGEVVDLKLEFNVNRKKFLVPVTVLIEPERLGIAQITKASEAFAGTPDALVKALVEQQGLRGQLQSVSLLTGQMMINLVFVPDAPKAMVSTRDGLQVIPTIHGSFERMQEGLARIVANLEKIKFDQISDELSQTLKEANKTLAGLSALAREVSAETTPKLQATLIELQKTLVEVQQGVGKDSPLNYTATKTLEELSLTLRSLRELAHTLNNQPQSILFGKEKQAHE